MSRAEKIKQFDPNGIGLKNGHFIGLPFEEADAQLILLPVPWDVTVSYSDGTATGPENILAASSQLDLFDSDVKEAWKLGLYFRPTPTNWLLINKEYRAKAIEYIDFLEKGGDIMRSKAMHLMLEQINKQCLELKKWVKKESIALLGKGKKVGVVGGEHSSPLGLIEALSETYEQFGILQIDAHMDLRKAYEGFTYSHASIFYNALQLPNITQLTQVGIRDYCEEEVDRANQDERIRVFYNHQIKRQLFKGGSFSNIVDQIIATLPQKVYISFDIDGLTPHLCPHTGTPVAGGIDFDEAIYILVKLVDSGREIIGFDLCEVGGLGHEWDGNVGARILYKLSNLAMASGK